MELREYDAVKFELADILRSIPGADDSSAPAPLQGAFRDLFARLAEDRFNLVVAGRFSRGKSTLMNALLGTDRLPTGVLPLTSVITCVTYGSRERVQIEFEGAAIGFDIAMEALPEYVTEHCNPGNVRRIRSARIELPSELLRRGFHFVDTPGLGSAILENTRTTEAFLPQADAVILVSGFDGPLTNDELRIADSITEAGLPLFFVLNKRDLASPVMQREVEDFVRSRLGEDADGAPQLFSISALEGLTARLTDDLFGYATSGVAELERKLTAFLIEEKHRLLLMSFADRARSVLESADPEGREQVLRDRLAQLKRSISADGASDRRTGAAAHETTGRIAIAAATAAARIEPCPVCTHLRETLFEFLRHYQSDLVRRPTERQRLAASAGLCGRHLWLYASLAADRDICVALAPLAVRTAEALHQAGGAGTAGEPAGMCASGAAALDRTVAICIACNRQQAAEALAIEEMVLRYDTQGSHDSSGLPSLCMPHLRLMARGASDPTLLRELAERQACAVERLVEDMQRYVLKHDGVRRGLTTEEERRAARRAIEFIAGDRLVCERSTGRTVCAPSGAKDDTVNVTAPPRG